MDQIKAELAHGKKISPVLHARGDAPRPIVTGEFANAVAGCLLRRGVLSLLPSYAPRETLERRRLLVGAMELMEKRGNSYLRRLMIGTARIAEDRAMARS